MNTKNESTHSTFAYPYTRITVKTRALETKPFSHFIIYASITSILLYPVMMIALMAST